MSAILSLRYLKDSQKKLDDLVALYQGKPLVVLGAGPSADYCILEISEFVAQGALFIVSDSISASFCKKYPQASVVICTVEQRSHSYLRDNQRGIFFCYQSCRKFNLPPHSRSSAIYFTLPGESNPMHLPVMVSPGTVVGIQLSLSLYIALRMKIYPVITMFGCDFAYLEDRMYGRFFQGNLVRSCSRFSTEESAQFLSILRRSSGGYSVSGTFIRTSAEFVIAREKIEQLLGTLPLGLSVFDYSPLGIFHTRVQKCVPESIEAGHEPPVPQRLARVRAQAL